MGPCVGPDSVLPGKLRHRTSGGRFVKLRNPWKTIGEGVKAKDWEGPWGSHLPGGAEWNNLPGVAKELGENMTDEELQARSTPAAHGACRGTMPKRAPPTCRR